MSNSGIRSRAPVPLDRCGMARASDILGDRWTLLILREAIYGVVRFADIQADTGVPRSVLSNRLAKLVDAGLLTRFEYTEDGARPRQGYRLTKRGAALATTFLAMKDWWDMGQETPPTVRFVPKGQAKPVRVALLDENGEEVDPADLKLQLD
ncbi:MAG: winged helix-turn-helix transcriptional regulator [Pseudomonadota bacterium]